MSNIKKNVDVYNREIELYGGYEYTINNLFSSVVASKRMVDTIIEKIPADAHTVIDIGCGDGTYTNEIKRGKLTINISGTDPAVNAIERAQGNYPDIEFFVSNLMDIQSLQNRHYDLAVLKGVLHHLTDQQMAIKNIASVADYMLFVEPNGNNPILKIIEKTSKYHIEHEEQSFSSALHVDWCTKAEWEVISLTYIGFVPVFFPTILAKIIYFFQPILEKTPILNKYLSAQIVILCKKKR